MSDQIISKIKNNYSEVLFHIIWTFVRDSSGVEIRNLVFGLLEFYPNELGAIPIEEQRNKVGKIGIYYQRVQIGSVEYVLQLYRSIAEKKIIPIFWKENGEIDIDILKESKDAEKNIQCGNMQYVRQWPNFTLSKRDDENGIPFIADAWDVCRIHQIFPDIREQSLIDLVTFPNVGEWLKEYLTWDISIYPELIGGVYLVLPNPFYSSKLIHMIPGEGEDKLGDFVKIDFKRRSKAQIPNLKVVPFEKTYFGVSGCEESDLTEDTITIHLAGRAEKFGFYVKDSEEIIDYEFFNGFLKGFSLDILTGYAVKEIHKPGADRTSLVDVYSSFNTVKSIEKERNIDRRFIEAEIFRRRNKKVKDTGFKIFYNNHDEAEKFLQELINSARKSIVIIDPYFSTMELFDYAVHVSVDGMSITIVTSAEHLKSKSRIKGLYADGKEPLIGDEFKAQLDRYNKWESGKQSTFVMTGDPAIHDRFLLVDDDAWFCGGSFNEVGNRLSCIIKIPDSRLIKEQIDDILSSDRVKEFDIWYRNWLENRSSNTDKM